MSGYSLIRYWSPTHCAKVARVSMSDASGMEYFATVPMSRLRGKGYREKLDLVLDAVQDAIDGGARGERGPGEVVLDG